MNTLPEFRLPVTCAIIIDLNVEQNESAGCKKQSNNIIHLCISNPLILCNATLHMKTSSNGNIFRVTGHLCGEFTGPGEFPTQRPVTRSFDVYFDLRPNKRLSKHSWGWWFETLSSPLWRHRNDLSTWLNTIHLLWIYLKLLLLWAFWCWNQIILG